MTLGVERASDGALIDIIGHPGRQWQLRTGGNRYELKHAWERGDPVEAPDVDGDDVRLVTKDEEDYLLVGREDGHGNLIVRTVLHADHERLGEGDDDE